MPLQGVYTTVHSSNHLPKLLQCLYRPEYLESDYAEFGESQSLLHEEISQEMIILKN